MSKLIYPLCVLLLIGLAGCGGGGSDNPLAEVLRKYTDKPTLSIILEDMKEEGSLFSSYYQKFRVLIPETKKAEEAEKSQEKAIESTVTDWVEVSEGWYMSHVSFLGMTLFSRKDGKVDAQKGPPGYEYVGDPRYGRWRTDSSGNRMWEFFAGYAMLNMMMGNRPVYYNNYTDYQTASGMRRPYYGSRDKQGRTAYGTAGTVTQTQKPNFYQRSMSSQAASRSGFSQSVNSRIGRSSVGVRGRSGGVGK